MAEYDGSDRRQAGRDRSAGENTVPLATRTFGPRYLWRNGYVLSGAERARPARRRTDPSTGHGGGRGRRRGRREEGEMSRRLNRR